MKKFALALCAATVLLACNDAAKKTEDAKSTVAPATNSKPADNTAKPPAMPDSATMAKNWETFMTPGNVHKMMASWDGNWTTEISMWMMPGAPEQKSMGKVVNRMVMGGRYQESDNTGTMMGMPFNGKSTLAYDNHRKEFISTWIDNMGSGMMIVQGTWDEASKTINLKGKTTDPGTTEVIDVRETYKIVDDNTHQMEMFTPGPDGKEFKMMSIKFTRKK